MGALGDAHGLKHDRVPEPLEAADQVALDRLAVALGDVVGAALLVDAGRVVQQVVDDAQDRVANGDGGPLLAPSRRQASVLRLERGPLGAAGCLGRLGERSTQPRTALPRLAAALLAGTLVVARTHPRPRREVVSRREPLHVRADLGDQHFGRPLPDAGDGVQSRHRRGEGLGPGGDLRADLRDALIQEVEVVELLRHQEALVRSELADQRLLQLGNLLAQPSFGQARRAASAPSPQRSAPAGWPVRTCP